MSTFSFFPALIDVSQSPDDEMKPIDVYAIGFEEMVDLDAKNIMNARLLVIFTYCRVMAVHPPSFIVFKSRNFFNIGMFRH